MSIVLPWPPYTLHPNSRPHWSVLARSKADYRYACHMIAAQFAGMDRLSMRKEPRGTTRYWR